MHEFNLQAVERRRKALKISRREMAKQLNFSNESVYWKYEKGEYKFKATTLAKLAEILKVQPQYFFQK